MEIQVAGDAARLLGVVLLGFQVFDNSGLQKSAMVAFWLLSEKGNLPEYIQRKGNWELDGTNEEPHGALSVGFKTFKYVLSEEKQEQLSFGGCIFGEINLRQHSSR